MALKYQYLLHCLLWYLIQIYKQIYKPCADQDMAPESRTDKWKRQGWYCYPNTPQNPGLSLPNPVLDNRTLCIHPCLAFLMSVGFSTPCVASGDYLIRYPPMASCLKGLKNTTQEGRVERALFLDCTGKKPFCKTELYALKELLNVLVSSFTPREAHTMVSLHNLSVSSQCVAVCNPLTFSTL